MSIFAEEYIEQNPELDLKRITIESVSFSDAREAFIRFLPETLSRIKGGLQSFFVKREENVASAGTVDLHKASRDLSSFLERNDFMTYADVLITVPEGFTGHLIDYIKELQRIGDEFVKNTMQSLNDYSIMLGSVINNKDFRQGLQDRRQFMLHLRKEIEVATETIGKYIDSHTTTSRQKLGDVMMRFADVEKILAAAAQLSNSQNGYNYRGIGNKVQETVGLLDIINQSIEKDEFENLSVAMTRNIADGAYEVARLVEFSAVYSYHCENVIACVENMTKQLEGFIGKK